MMRMFPASKMRFNFLPAFKSTFLSSGIYNQPNSQQLYSQIVATHQECANNKKPLCHYKRKKRYRYRYADNQTAALVWPYDQAMLDKYQGDTEMLLMLSKDQIIEHAARRVDLFFYTLIAYYKKELVPELGKTRWQYGIGRGSQRKSITQACHSSFFGGFEDGTAICSDGLLSNTHFLQSLNATVELPWFVNKLDDELENHAGCRKYSVDILQRVSSGEWDPVRGLTVFLKMMQDTLTRLATDENPLSRQVSYLNRSQDGLIREQKLKLLAWVREGTLKRRFDERSQTINPDYVRLLLRMSEDTGELDPSNYMKQIRLIQDEILNARQSRIDSNLKVIQDRKHVEATCRNQMISNIT